MALRRKASEQAKGDLASKWSQLSYFTPMPAHKLLLRLLPSLFCFFFRIAEPVQTGKCREAPADRALKMQDWENQRGSTVVRSLGRSVHIGFFVSLGKAGKIGCKPNSSHCEILGFKVRMYSGELELLLEVCYQTSSINKTN